MLISVPQETAFRVHGDLDDARQIGIVETIGVADTLVGHDLQIFSAERMARVRW